MLETAATGETGRRSSPRSPGAQNLLELSGTDSTLTALKNATSIFRQPFLTTNGELRGLFQPDNQDAGGPDLGPAGGLGCRQSGDQARSSAVGAADAERRDRRAALGGCRRRACHHSRRGAADFGPAAPGQRRQLATTAVPRIA